MATNSSKDITQTMEEWFSKIPSLPKNIQETLANISPYIALIFGILGILGSIGGMGAMTFVLPFAPMGGAQAMQGMGTGYIMLLGSLASSVMMVMAYSGLKARKISGWTMLFWSEGVSLVASVLGGGFVSGIISSAIGFYLLFQIKPFFKK